MYSKYQKYITEQRGEKMFQKTPEDMRCGRDGKYRQYRNKNEEKERKNVMSLKNSKHFRRFAAALMAGTMMISMFGMTAFAENGGNGEMMETKPAQEVQLIQKFLTKDENLYAPVADFTFQIRSAEDDELATISGGDGSSVQIQPGPEGGLVFTNGSEEDKQRITISSVPADGQTGETRLELGLNAEGESLLGIEVNENTFTETGIYRYVISEMPGEVTGVTYDQAVKYVDVYVTNAESGEGFEYSYTVVSKDGTTKDWGNFENKYDYKKDDETVLYDLTVKKEIKGNQANLSDTFDFTITIDPDTDGEMFYVEIFAKDADPDSADPKERLTLKKTERYSVTFALGNGEFAVVYGLSAGDKYIVSEEDCSGEGYVTKIDNEKVEDGNYTSTGNLNADKTIVYENIRNASTPTGVVLNIAPYIAMVALAGVLAFVFLRRRHNNF